MVMLACLSHPYPALAARPTETSFSQGTYKTVKQPQSLETDKKTEKHMAVQFRHLDLRLHDWRL